MCNVVVTVTLQLATSVTESERVVTTQVRPLGPARFPLQPYSMIIVMTLSLLAGSCQLSQYGCVAAAKSYVQRSNSGRNSSNSGRLLTSLS